MQIILTKSYEESAKMAAEHLLAALQQKPDLLLGLATGETAVGIYQHMVAAYQKGEADFSRARSVNLDEYVGCGEQDSYRYFMEQNLFNHINLPEKAVTIADYRKPAAEELRRMRTFFAKNRVDIQLLGIGPNGHIGFNEPGEVLQAHMHEVQLAEETIAANARFFASPDSVPRTAMTMGMADIMHARKIMLVIKGESKRRVASELIHGCTVSVTNPASFLRLHPDTVLICEESIVK